MDDVRRQEYVRKIQQLRLIDDTFFNCCFADSPECMELLLRIILNKPALKVIRVIVQNFVPSIYGREVRFDVYAEDEDGTIYDIEIQRSQEGADPRRARYNSSMLDTAAVSKGAKWNELPEIKVIFITEGDTLKGGKPIYHIRRRIEELDKSVFDDKSEIIYVNAAVQGEDALGKLAHDFLCERPEDMHYKVLADRVRFFKHSEEGVTTVCKIMEEMIDKGRKEGRKEGIKEGRKEGRKEGIKEGRKEGRREGVLASLRDLMETTNWSVERAMEALKIAPAEQKEYRVLLGC